MLCWEALVQVLRPRPVRGSFRAAPFDATGSDSDAVGRRATTEWIGSISPNTIVAGVPARLIRRIPADSTPAHMPHGVTVPGSHS